MMVMQNPAVFTPATLAEPTWRTIPGFPLYEVSSCGQVRALRRRGSPGRNLAIKIGKGGYERVALFDGARRRTDIQVHRLVLMAFVGPRPDNHVAAHLDGNSRNNVVSNLKWVTQKENMAHREAHGNTRRGVLHPECKLSAEEIAAIKDGGGGSLRELAAKFGVHHSTIWRIRAGRTYA
jgi:hypothetical protein